jgi:hypothetical protein
MRLLGWLDDLAVDFTERQCHRLQLWTGWNNFSVGRFMLFIGFAGFATFSIWLFGFFGYFALPIAMNGWIMTTLMNGVMEAEVLKHLCRGCKNPFRLILVRNRICGMLLTFTAAAIFIAPAIFPLWLWLISILDSCTPLPPAQDKKRYLDWKTARARAKERQAPVGLPVPA